VLDGDAGNTNFTVFGLAQTKIYGTWGEQANYYTTGAAFVNLTWKNSLRCCIQFKHNNHSLTHANLHV